MLMMKCSQCSQYIKSELLAELVTIRCEHCQAEVAVKGVLVSSNGFTFDRDDLLKRFFRYRKLLDEVIDERNQLNASATASKESKRSIDQFLTILQGMMTGARGNFRYQFDSSVTAELICGLKHHRGRFINLSMEGACMRMDAESPLPRVGALVSLNFSLPGQDQHFNPTCMVCWAEQGKASSDGRHAVGLRFREIDDLSRDALWKFISERAESDRLPS
jgi:DNA-directed RNA polymerase subunit RPC12/RpoP